MKKFLLLSTILIYSNLLSQSAYDTREFIIEKYQENTIEPYEKSFLFFSTNILKKDTEFFFDKTLTRTEFDNCFIWCADIETGQTTSRVISYSEAIDIRGINKISITKTSINNYTISLYLKGGFTSVSTVHNTINKTNKRKYNLERMKIPLAGNKEVAVQIKKAIIHLGKLKGISIKDGDLF